MAIYSAWFGGALFFEEICKEAEEGLGGLPKTASKANFGNFMHFEALCVFVNFTKIDFAMTASDHIRNGIIEKLLTISNKDYLNAILKVVQNSSTDMDLVKLTEEQVVMLNLSERDLNDGKLITQSQLDKADLKWLKEL